MGVDPQPFELDGGRLGVLCIHGYTGTPFEMRHLGERLGERGMTVACPRLPGHGTDPGDLDRITWRDWFDAVDDTFSRLRAKCDNVCIAGQSLGGLLALELARERGNEIAAVAALATPLWLTSLGKTAVAAARAVPRFSRWVPNLPKLGGRSDVRSRDARRDNPSYPVLPTRGVLELAELMDRVRAGLADVEQPLLVLHGRGDHTAPAACADALARGVSSETVRLRILPRSYHLISLDVERDTVASEVGAFFEREGREA